MFPIAQISLPDVNTGFSDVVANVTVLIAEWLFPGLLLVSTVMLAVVLFKAVRGKFRLR